MRVADDTSGWCCIGIWGPRAQEIVDSVAEEPLTPRSLHGRRGHDRRRTALALRVSYVGEHGWDGRAAVAHGPAQHAQARHQQFFGFLPPLAWRAALYFATSALNFASVDENAWPPLPHGLTT